LIDARTLATEFWRRGSRVGRAFGPIWGPDRPRRRPGRCRREHRSRWRGRWPRLGVGGSPCRAPSAPNRILGFARRAGPSVSRAGPRSVRFGP